MWDYNSHKVHLEKCGQRGGGVWFALLQGLGFATGIYLMGTSDVKPPAPKLSSTTKKCPVCQ